MSRSPGSTVEGGAPTHRSHADVVVDLGPSVVDRAGSHRQSSEAGLCWDEWACPACGNVYDHDLGVCPDDLTPLEKRLVSMPFLWLG